MSLRHAVPVALFAALALLIAACGTKTIDTGKAESEIGKGVAQQTGAKSVKVDCPDDVDAKKGDTFDCDLTAAGGQKAKIKVTQQDDKGNVRWTLAR